MLEGSVKGVDFQLTLIHKLTCGKFELRGAPPYTCWRVRASRLAYSESGFARRVREGGTHLSTDTDIYE